MGLEIKADARALATTGLDFKRTFARGIEYKQEWKEFRVFQAILTLPNV